MIVLRSRCAGLTGGGARGSGRRCGGDSWHKVASRLSPLFPAGVEVVPLPAREPAPMPQLADDAAPAAPPSLGDPEVLTPVVTDAPMVAPAATNNTELLATA